jgi:hypothetical protein
MRLTRVVVPLLSGVLLVAAAVVPIPTAAVAAIPTAASAKIPMPKVRTFGAVVDAVPRWERENTCSPTQKPGAAALRKLLRKTYGASITSSTLRPCSRADSGHEEGRAVDWMTNRRVPAQKALAEAFLAWLQAPDGYGNPEAMARRLGVEYVIWNNRMWRAYDPTRGWTVYDHCLSKKKRHKKTYDNACHRTHVHISLSWDGAYQRTSFSTGFVACPTATQPWPAPAPAPSVDGLGFVAVPPARILSTRYGTGTAIGPCRVHSGARLDLPVLGYGGVPTTGVAAVVLRVGLLQADSLTGLRVWPAGTPMPRDPVAAANPGSTAALITVPVGANGMISLLHSAGMSHLTADVVGYYVSPGLVGDHFTAVGPTRVLSDVTVAPGAAVSVDLKGSSGVSGVHSGLLTVTVTGVAAGGLTAYAPDSAIPTFAALSFAAGETMTGSVLARAGPDGTVRLLNTSKSPVMLSVDLQGVFAPTS